MQYCAEIQSDTVKTELLLETTKINVFRKKAGRTLLNRERSEVLRRICEKENNNN